MSVYVCVEGGAEEEQQKGGERERVTLLVRWNTKETQPRKGDMWAPRTIGSKVTFLIEGENLLTTTRLLQCLVHVLWIVEDINLMHNTAPSWLVCIEKPSRIICRKHGICEREGFLGGNDSGAAVCNFLLWRGSISLGCINPTAAMHIIFVMRGNALLKRKLDSHETKKSQKKYTQKYTHINTSPGRTR